METIRSRIAPTPSGFLHFGNIYSFIFTWLYVRKNKGTLLLRIDDLDKARIRKEYIDDIFQTLDWLEIDYDEGPIGTEDFLKNYSQKTRIELYVESLQNLKNHHHLFACTCSRAAIKTNSFNGQYAGTCLLRKNAFENKNTAWRLNHPESIDIQFLDKILGKTVVKIAQHINYPVLKRKDDLPAYQIASLVDDTYYKINTIIRGEDLLPSTALQIYLAEITNKPSFLKANFLHHSLIKGTANQKLSKSQAAPAIHLWKNQPNGKMKLFREIAVLLNVDPHKVENIHDLLQEFNLDLSS